MSSKSIIKSPNPAATVCQLHPYLTRSSTTDNRPIALMTCGIAGAGKTTLSREILAAHPTFTRLSIDENIHAAHGLYGIDYAAGQHAAYADEADALFQRQFHDLLARAQDVLLDRAFYDRADREEYRALAERAGARCVLVYLPVERGELWRRIGARRREGITANCALEITEEVFEGYWAGFEHPDGEGEIVVVQGEEG